MEKTNKSLKEWNAVVEALGQGKQSILIRKYGTKNIEFLLNPTIRYATQNNYLQSFQNKYNPFVEKFKLPKKDNNKVEVKYFAVCEKIVEKSSNRIGALKDYYIWDPKHIKDYLGNKTAYIWLLRVYELNNPIMVEPTPHAILFANLKKKVDISDAKPVISDKEFKEISKNIK